MLTYIASANLLLTTDRELCELFIRIRPGLDCVEEADQMRVLVWYGTVFRHYQNAFNSRREGLIADVQWENLSGPLGRNLTYPGQRDCWEIIRGSFTPEFQAYVEKRAEEVAAETT